MTTTLTPRATGAVASRVLTQLRRDRRTLAMLLVLPCALMTLLWWMFGGLPGDGFSSLGPALLALVPFVIMFLVTSVTTLRERTSGTLERLLAMPMGKLDFLLGYAVAFGLAATAQSALAVAVCVWVLDLSIVGDVLAADGRRRRRRAARYGARPVRLGLRAHGVPGGAVHAGAGDPADPAVRAVRPARRSCRAHSR